MFTRRNLLLAAGMAAAVMLTAGALIAGIGPAASATPALRPGAPAPAFTATGAAGETVSLADFSGKTIVLEWTNADCPFVKKHYAPPAHNMQTLQARAEAEGVVWLSVISSAPGKQGYVSGAEALEIASARGARPAHMLLDPQGELGRLYGAKTTPHMFVINSQGEIAYQGAIDSIPTAKADDLAKAVNYVAAALDSLQAGEAVAVMQSAPYGCSIKY